jgi:hypothetical protein
MDAMVRVCTSGKALDGRVGIRFAFWVLGGVGKRAILMDGHMWMSIVKYASPAGAAKPREDSSFSTAIRIFAGRRSSVLL